MRWLDGITSLMDMRLSMVKMEAGDGEGQGWRLEMVKDVVKMEAGDGEGQGGLECCSPWGRD